MNSRFFIKWGWLYVLGVLFTGLCQIDTMAEIIGGDDPWQNDKRSYRPYPILFLHGFAGGSNYTWNPDPNAKNQAEEQKEPTAVLNEYFKKYFRIDFLALHKWTQFPYLETIEFFNSKSSDAEQLMDRNSSVDRFKIGDYYVEHGVWWFGWHKKKEGDPGWADKVSYALRGEPIHDLSKYLYDTGAGGGSVLKNYLPPNATSFKALLICHSMGGLSAREYLTNKTLYPGVEKSVDKLITIDTPHLGSVLAVLADATVEVQRIATAMSITQPALGWLMAIPPVIEGIDNGLQLFSKIDIDGDAVNDMDPVSLLGRFGSGFLGQLNARTHPQGVSYYIVYGSLPFAQIIDGFSIKGFIDSLMDGGISKGEIEELLEKEYGAEISTDIGEIIVTEIGDGVVSENSQRGILRKEENKPIRVFEIAKESIKGIPTEIGINADHSAATKKVVEVEADDVPPLLKLIDYTKPRLEIASPQEGFIWESGVTITLEGKVYDEYLPADSSLKIELYKAGDNFNPVFSEVRKPDPITGYTPLKPTTLWRANDSNTPVAEFREDVMLPSGANPEVTYTIRLTVINPAGISSDPKQATEKTFYLYGVGGTSNLWCIDGPTSFADGRSAVVSEFNLVDENRIKIQSRPLDIATSGNTIWVSFDDRRIRRYNIYGEAERLDSTNWYWTVSNIPDGLYYDGSGLQYCSSSINKLYRITLSTGIESGVGVISRNLLLDGDSNAVNREYSGYSPTGISDHYLCSGPLGKISKKVGWSSSQIDTKSQFWTNEQNIPALPVGIAEITDYSVPENRVIYISCTDGNVYKVRFADLSSSDINARYQADVSKRSFLREDEIGLQQWPGTPLWWNLPPGSYYPGFAGVYWGWWKYDVYDKNLYSTVGPAGIGEGGYIDVITRKYRSTWRTYYKVTPPTSYKAVYVRYKPSFAYLQGSLTYQQSTDSKVFVCSFDESWRSDPYRYANAYEIFNNPILISHLFTIPFDVPPSVLISNRGNGYYHLIDLTSISPKSTFYMTHRYGDEDQILTVPNYSELYTWHSFATYPDGYGGSLPDLRFLYLIDEGSLEILDQFTTPTGIWEGIGAGSRINMRIKTGYPSSINIGGTMQLEAHGKEPLAWVTSDGNAGKVDSNGLFTAVGKGTCTVTVQDTLGNMTTSGVITVQ